MLRSKLLPCNRDIARSKTVRFVLRNLDDPVGIGNVIESSGAHLWTRHLERKAAASDDENPSLFGQAWIAMRTCSPNA